MIAATSSGCGKTTLSLGLMRALVRMGKTVRPFKSGPDYIDTQFHAKASGAESINLDTFMSSEEYVRTVFRHYSYDKDVAVVEGVMGLFDGYSKMSGSCAGLSVSLSVPVILVVNAASTAYSVAATIYGFRNFKPDVRIAGVIFNRVASESHYSFLKDACKDAGTVCLGYMKRDNSLQTPSRHLGLTLTAERDMESFINSAADSVESTVDIDRLLQLTEYDDHEITSFPEETVCSRVAAVAYDEAFNFIYPENMRMLRRQGYDIVRFSPIHDRELPRADFVYLPGGYPELFADELSANKDMMESVGNYVGRGGMLWGECGGMIYLAEEIDGVPLCGVLPFRCTMEDSKLTLGYRTVRFGDAVFKGHEFHYSRLRNPDALPSVAEQRNVRGMTVSTPVYRYRNAFASYTHLYWGDNNLFKIWES